MKRVLKWTGLGLLFISILFFMVFLNRESLGYFALRKAAQFYAEKADLALDIGSISATPFSEITVGNLSIVPKTGKPQAFSFKAQSITCTYNLWDLKEGYELFLQGLSCSADAPELNYDFRIAVADDQTSQETAPFFVPAILPRIELQNGTVILSGSNWKSESRKVKGRLHSAAAAHELQLEVGSCKFIQDDVTKIDTGFNSLLRYSGKRLSIDALVVGEEEISATGFIGFSQFFVGCYEV